jgi:hypothetical protein
MSLKEFSEGFNHFWLRYAPPTCVVAVVLLDSYGSVRKALIASPSLGIGFIIFCSAAMYAASWPILLAHVWRTSKETRKKMSDEKSKANEIPSKSCVTLEHIRTFRDMREHGNAMYLVGCTFLHIGLFVKIPISSTWGGRTGLQSGLNVASGWPGVFALLLAVCGALVWLKASSEEIVFQGYLEIPDLLCSKLCLFLPLVLLAFPYFWLVCR